MINEPNNQNDYVLVLKETAHTTLPPPGARYNQPLFSTFENEEINESTVLRSDNRHTQKYIYKKNRNSTVL